VEPVPFSAIDLEGLRRSGEAVRESLRKRAVHSGLIADETLLYREWSSTSSDRDETAVILTVGPGMIGLWTQESTLTTS
jgi:hypothetical protein